ncbi:DUF6178 family protein [Desulfatibacillum alkenivorans]|nr:DUF6178 family protein [Desulfatibacillum alkenivorans]
MDIEKKQPLSLENTREQILEMPAQEALDAIISHPKAGALVKSFSAQDLYFLIHEIGLDDCLPVLSLASTRQWQYLMDVDIWKNDRVDQKALVSWMDKMLAADPERLVKWMATVEADLLEMWMYENVSVLFLEHDQDPSELPEGYFSLDGAIYIKIKDSELTEDKNLPDLDDMTREILKLMAEMDYTYFHKMMFELHGVIPSETEENLFRIRNVRLAERGFTPPHEAAAIYQKLDAETLAHRPKKILAAQDGPGYAQPFLSNHFAKGENRFSQSLAAVDDPNIARLIQSEFAALCNQVIAADKVKLHSREDLQKFVKKTSGYLNMGLEEIREKTGEAPAASIRNHPLTEIFQAGFGLALNLKFKAQKWRRDSWFQKNGLPLSFWGEERLGVLGGLLLDKPLVYDNYQSGALYRDFSSRKDVEDCEKILDGIIALDGLFARMNCLKSLPDSKKLNCENLLLTPWANDLLGKGSVVEPLSLEGLKAFFQELFDPAEHMVRDSMKHKFLEWLALQTKRSPEEIGRTWGHALTGLFDSLEEQYGRVRLEALDSRYIHSVWVV